MDPPSVQLQSSPEGPEKGVSAVNDAKPPNTLNACIPCRKVKMKCRPSEVSSACFRCQRKNFDCVYENHRRGRKPGTKLRRRAQSPDSGEAPSTGRRPSDEATGQANEDLGHQQYSPTLQAPITNQAVGQNGLLSIPEKGKKIDGLSPFRLLNRHAMGGSFSVENVLEAESAGDTDESVTKTKRSPRKNSLQGKSQDPVALGLITLPSAMQLFDSFIKYMAPYIIHFDPLLHTYEYIQDHSSFLLATILSASAKIFNPELHPKLHKHAEDLLGKAFTSGEKNIDTIKAVMMLTYWKQPDDTRVWQLVGYACRMCVELRGRKAQPRKSDDTTTIISPMQLREKRTLERVWLTLFVYDRSVSLQLGKQWMLHIDDLTRRVDTWYQDELAIPNGDAILAAFVELRVLSSDLLDVLDIDSSSGNQQQHEMLLSIFNTDLDKWDQKWNDAFDKMPLEPCHQFLYRFYSRHTRLYINSLRLQVMLVNMTSVAKRSLWLSYTSALDMLQAIVDILAPAKLLYYAQDSIHVMTAYATVFLIKILLSMPEALPATAESTIIAILAKTSEAFGSQCASNTTGCAYQARFLRNVVTQYWTSKKAKLPAESTEGPTESNERTAILSAATYLTSLGSTSNELNHQAEVHPSLENNSLGFSVRPSMMFPYVEPTAMELANQPFWHQNVMDPEVWEGLLTDGNFYINTDDATMMTGPY